jgi:hypothetical protein
MSTITATVTPADPIPTVQVDAVVDTPGTVVSWSVSRNTPDGSTIIWYGSAAQPAMSLVDNGAPLGVSVTYTLTIIRTGSPGSSEQITSDAVTITGTAGCWLTSLATGQTIAVELATWPARNRDARQSRLEVLARPDPVGLVDTHSTPAGVWTFITRTDDATDTLTRLLLGGIAALRTQPGSSIHPCTALVGNIAEKRYTGAGGDQRRLVDVAIQEIAAVPGTAYPIAATLYGLSIYQAPLYDTLAKLATLRPTLVGLSQIPVG